MLDIIVTERAIHLEILEMAFFFTLYVFYHGREEKSRRERARQGGRERGKEEPEKLNPVW